MATIKLEGLVLLTGDGCSHYLGIRSANAHANCCNMMVNCFKQALCLAIATAEDHDVVGTGELGHMDVGSHLNPWVTLQADLASPCSCGAGAQYRWRKRS